MHYVVCRPPYNDADNINKYGFLYFQIDKCPMQTRGQTSLFGGSMDCNCGFHTAKVIYLKITFNVNIC